MTDEDIIDPVSFADRWSFNGRFYLWVSFFHGISLLTGRDVSAHDAFKGTIFHTDLFGPNGALYHRIDGLQSTEALRRLEFGEKAMARIRENEVRYLFRAARTWKTIGLLIGIFLLLSPVGAIIGGVADADLPLVKAGIGVFLPLTIGTIGKTAVRRMWSRKARKMGAFVSALPWMYVSRS